MAGESPEDTLRTLFHSTQRGLRFIVLNAIEQLITYQLRLDKIRKTLNTHKVKSFNIDAASNKLSTSILLILPFATFLTGITDKVMEGKEYITIYALKERMETIQTFTDEREQFPRRSNSWDGEVPLEKS